MCLDPSRAPITALPPRSGVSNQLRQRVPADRARCAHPEPRSRLAARRTFLNRRNYPLAKINRQGPGHPCPASLAGMQLESDRSRLGNPDESVSSKHALAVIGARKASELGRRRARQFARQLAENGVVVVSGLADGIDTEALEAAIDAGGKVVGVIGTPLSKAYPAKNAELQEAIYRDHLLISQFPSGARVFPSNFPARNRTMAALSDASVVIEASDTSGTRAIFSARRPRRGVHGEPDRRSSAGGPCCVQAEAGAPL